MLCYIGRYRATTLTMDAGSISKLLPASINLADPPQMRRFADPLPPVMAFELLVILPRRGDALPAA